MNTLTTALDALNSLASKPFGVFVIVVAIFVSGWAISYQLGLHSDRITHLETTDTTHSNQVDELKISDEKLKKDIEYIKGDLVEIKADIREMKSDIKEIYILLGALGAKRP